MFDVYRARIFYQILDMRDGDTDVANIAGTSVSVYDPDTSILGLPVYRVGDEFTEYPKYVKSRIRSMVRQLNVLIMPFLNQQMSGLKVRI